MSFLSEKKFISIEPNVSLEHWKRKVYTKPRLEDLGDLRTLTLGGSPGTGESSGGGTRKRRPFGLSPYDDFPLYNPDGTLRDPNEPLDTP